MRTTEELLKNAKQIANRPPLSTACKKQGLLAMADALWAAKEEILTANAQDVEKARGHIGDVMIDRLRLDESRLAGMTEGMKAVAELPDPVGRVLEETVRPNGLQIRKIAVPFGVVAIIYESRPNVTSDAAALAFQSGNVCVLKSGSDAFFSASAIVKALRRGLAQADVAEDYVNLVEEPTREAAGKLMTAQGLVDLLIPRGGKGLIRACVENAKVPIIETGTGICHVYIDRAADLEKALNITDNAKTSRPSVCNAAEVCLVHRDIAPTFLPRLAERFDGRVEIRGDEEVCRLIKARPAGETDFDTEFLDRIMAVAVVDSVEQATAHIARHSTHHSESIVTEDPAAAEIFTSRVDSAAVYVNASTRFTDGGEFGLGCEMGISTQKLHARGPMGLRELTTYRYIITGNGQIR
ncbi:MAG: glutamate-5-semialdehyde dehydrogenase [Clostridia bacterium]|nr:glutamate-5-semialdehyde dehydrogenase [Clostridia bacterium]